MPPRVIYLHGFASGPGSAKAVAVARHLRAVGIPVAVPDLNLPSFEKLDLAAQQNSVTAMLHRDPHPTLLVGSSLGGYLAALLASTVPAVPSVVGILLLAPAFDLARRWRDRLPPGVLQRWQSTGAMSYPHHALGHPALLHYDFLAQADTLPPFPSVSVPACVVQGRRDDVVSPTVVRHWIDQNPSATYVEVDDGHDLVASIPRITLELDLLVNTLHPSATHREHPPRNPP